MMPFPVHETTRISRAMIRIRVLVIDSEPLIRWSLCTALDAEGFDAIAAADAAEAGRLANEWPPPKVVVVDLRHPDREGRELLACIRAVYRDCRFLVMTTDRRAAAMDEGRGTGVEILEKPFDLVQLIETVVRLAGRHTPAARLCPDR
jgi:two-component system, OmpR family, response regulator